MTQFIQIEWTCGLEQEAQEVVQMLLNKRLIACANLVSPVQSFYVWEGTIESSREVKVLMKAPAENFAAINECIEKHASYDVPAILALPILDGSSSYLNWLETETEKNSSRKN